MFSLLIGAIAAPASYWGMRLLKRSGVDDHLDCLAGHGLAGCVGIILTGLFAQRSEDSPSDGAFFGNPMLLGIQLAGVGVTLLTCVIGTTLSYWILWIIARILRLEIRVEQHHESTIDDSQHREQAYVHAHNARGTYENASMKGYSMGTEDLNLALLEVPVNAATV